MISPIQILDLQQGSDEWLKVRMNHLGASDAPAIMGISPWMTPNQLWRQKLGLDDPVKENETMRRGKQLEPIARQEFIKESKWDVWPTVVKNSKYDWMLASMDGIRTINSRFGQHITHAVEIKIPGKIDHEMAMDGIIPSKYIPQLIHQMIVCELQEIFYFSWNESSNKIITFSLHELAAQELIEKEKEFWEMVHGLEEPALTDRDYVDMTGDNAWESMAAFWKIAKENKKRSEQLEEEYRNKLIQLSNEKNCHGNDVRLTKYIRKGSVDTKKIVADYNIDEEKYRKEPTTAWRIS